MSYCSLAEAFTGPAAGPAGAAAAKAQKRHKRTKEGFVPAALSGAPDPDRISVPLVPPTSELLQGPPSSQAQPAGDGVKLDDLFPLPGETGESEEWEKAFTLEGSRTPGPASSVLGLQGPASSVLGMQGHAPASASASAPASSGPASATAAATAWVRPDGSVPVAGKSTLWRQIPVPPPVQELAPAFGSSAMSGLPSEITHRLDSLSRQLETLSAPSPMQSTAELFLFVAIGLLILLAVDTLLRFAVTIASKQFGGGRGRSSGGRGFRFRSRW